MSYRIYAFDGIELPRFRLLDDEHNMGTGRALTAFQQLPGGWFDHYGSLRSPQGIRPITAQGWLVESAAAALRTAQDALRAKLGVRGKLTVLFEDAQLRWQWARLVEVETPARPAYLYAAPVELRFETADQVWFGIVVSPVEWTWGDLAWTFGDGTAEYGEAGTEADLTAGSGGAQSFTVTHGGSIRARSVAVVITAGTTEITNFRYFNYTTNEQMAVTDAIAAGESLVVNGGDRSVWLRTAARNLDTAINSLGVTANINTDGNHGFSTGDTVLIAGTGIWDGIHRNITVSGVETFNFPSALVGTVTAQGTVRKLTSKFSNFASLASRFPSLAAGENTITLSPVNGNTAGDATISWEFYTENA